MNINKCTNLDFLIHRRTFRFQILSSRTKISIRMHKNKICPNSFTQNHLREDPRTDREGGRRMSLCHHSAEFSGLRQPQVNSTWVHKGPELWSQKTFSTEKKKKKSLSCTDFLSTFRIRDSNRIYLFPAAEQRGITAPCPTPAAASAVG